MDLAEDGGIRAVSKQPQMPLRRHVASKIFKKDVGGDFAFEERYRREPLHGCDHVLASA